MQVPLHPAVVHLPIALAFLMPLLVLTFAIMIRKKNMNPISWGVVLGLQLLLTGSSYLALETGETDEEMVEKVVERKLIQEHEEAAEMFAGSTVIALVLSVVAFFVIQQFQFRLQMSVLAVTLLSAFLAYRTGMLGGELVYVHGAPSAYQLADEPQGILPTPGQNTSESSFPVEENESLKADEFDYGNDDEMIQEEDGMKQED